MRFVISGLVALIALPAPVGAQPAVAIPAPGEHSEAFDRSYATSFYTFDACGDAVSGRIYRQALVERFNGCPFSASAKQRFRQRTVAQRHRSGEVIESMIEATGGLPIRLEGMAMTCREQQSTSDYRALRARLEQYVRGAVKAEAIVPAPCDADLITP